MDSGLNLSHRFKDPAESGGDSIQVSRTYMSCKPLIATGKTALLIYINY